MALIHNVTIFEDSGVVLMGLFKGGDDGEAVQQADISSIAYSVWDITDTSSPSETATGTLTVANVIYDTLQTDSRWSKGGDGYNFLWEAPSTLFPDGSKTYRLEIKFTPSAGEPFHGVYEIQTKNLYRS